MKSSLEYNHYLSSASFHRSSGGSTGYAIYATAYPAIQPCVACVLHLALLEQRAWNRPSLTRVDSPACLTVTYYSIEETHCMQGQPTNEYSLLEGLVEYRLQLRRCYICIYCSDIDQHQYHVSTSYIRIVLHAIFQLCTPTSTA